MRIAKLPSQTIALRSTLCILAILASLLGCQSQAQTLTTLYSFVGSRIDGFHPSGNVSVDSEGNVYGTTQGSDGSCKRNWLNCGTIFKVTPGGTETTLHAFATGKNAHPMSGLIADSTGDFYGTTYGTGGATELDGTVFRLKKQKSSKAIYTFRGNRLKRGDGAHPAAGVVMDSAGNFYGTTENGGAYGYGAVYKLSTDGTETILFSFGGYNGDGIYPASALLIDTDGNLYGTTTEHTGLGCPCGTVFKLSPSGVETLLHTFDAVADGALPYGGLIMDSQGNLYGTTYEGGVSTACSNGCGIVYKVTPSGTESVLHSFSGVPDGAGPFAGLVMDSHGNLFGTTMLGGSANACPFDTGCGTVFEITAGGVESTVYNFCSLSNCADGAEPESPLTFDTQGNLYGTTTGGIADSGTVFKLRP